MKRVLVALGLLLLVLALTATAQAQRVSGGFKGGVNVATIGGNDVQDASNLAGPAGGGFLVVKLSDLVAFQPELLYSAKGAKNMDAGAIRVLKVKYIEVPLLMRVATRGMGGVTPFVFAGPSVGVNAWCEAERQDDASQTYDCNHPTLNSPIKDLDYGAVVGAGSELAVRRTVFSLDARYTVGLGSIDDSSAARDIKTRTFSFMVGVRFNAQPNTTLAAR